MYKVNDILEHKHRAQVVQIVSSTHPAYTALDLRLNTLLQLDEEDLTEYTPYKDPRYASVKRELDKLYTSVNKCCLD